MIRNKKLWKIPIPIIIASAIILIGGGALIYALTRTAEDSGPVGYWKLDEGSGYTAYDASGNGNNGTLTNFDFNQDSDWTSGKVAGALEFDGVDDAVDVGSKTLLFNAITVEAWIKPSISPAAKVEFVVYKKSGSYMWALEHHTVGFLWVLTGADNTKYYNASGRTGIVVNQWNHLVATQDGTTVNLYINGKLTTTETFTTSPNEHTGAGQIIIGNDESNGFPFSGLVDEVRIYDRALSAAEVRWNYNRGGPIAHWKFNEGSATKVYDLTDNNNDGRIKSSALKFDGVDDYIDCGSGASLDLPVTNSFTVEAWIYLTGTPSTHRYVIAKEGSSGNWTFFLSYRNDGRGIEWYAHNGTGYLEIYNQSVTLSDDTWYHIVGTYDASADAVNVYVDGVFKASDSSYSIIGRGAESNLYIGESWNLNSPFLGIIDEFRIYNRGLSANEIAEHYNGKFSDETGLVLYLPFDDEAGATSTDSSGQGNNGTLTSFDDTTAKYGDASSTGWVIDTDWEAGRENTALKFGGVNGFFQTDNNIASSAEFSHSLWFKSSDGTYSADEYLLSQATTGDPAIYIESTDNKIKVMADGSLLLSSNTTVNNTDWHHVQISADGSNMYLYLDGILENSVAYTGTSDATGVAIGANITRASFFNGYIDDVRIYNYARTAAEVRIDYNFGQAVQFGSGDYDLSRGLVGHWKMEEGKGARLLDSSNEGNDGTLTNFDFNRDSGWTSGNASANTGQALKFDGTDDYIEATVSESTTTISMWVQNSGTWEHVVNANGSEYVNGASSTPSSYPIYFSGNTVQIGKTGASAYFSGKIDDVRIYNRALSADEIRYLYNRRGPIGWWKFDEGSSSGTVVYDSSINSNNGIIYGASTTAGKINSALSFDGENDYVERLSWTPLETGEALTLEAWLRPDRDDTLESIIGLGDWAAYKFLGPLKLSTGELQFRMGNAANNAYTAYWTSTLTTSMPKDSFHHVVVTYDQSASPRTRGFVNGIELAGTDTGSGADRAKPNTYLEIGCLDDAHTHNFDGIIDDVRIYNYARTAEEIRTDYNEGFATKFGPSNSAGIDLERGLVGHWDFEEGSGYNAYDSSNEGNDGTLNNFDFNRDSGWASGNAAANTGQALKFDGVDDYVNAGNDNSLNFDSNSAITIESWVKANTLGEYTSIFNRWQSPYGYALAFTDTGKLRFYFDNHDRETASVYITTGSWFHVAATWDGSGDDKVRFYVDGVLKETSTAISTLTATNQAAIISGISGGFSYFNGLIDEVRIYNRALSAKEIQQLYNRRQPIGHWKFDSGNSSGTTAYDSSINGNHGTIYGASSTAGKINRALSFDGADDYIEITNDSSLAFTSAVTAEVWVNPAVMSNGLRIIQRTGRGFELEIAGDSPNTKFRTYMDDSGSSGHYFDSDNVIQLDTWQHIVTTYDGSQQKLYVNGVLQSGTLTWSNTLDAGSVITIGAYEGGGAFRWDGLIDDVRIYNYVRTAEEIRQDYNNGMSAYFE